MWWGLTFLYLWLTFITKNKPTLSSYPLSTEVTPSLQAHQLHVFHANTTPSLRRLFAYNSPSPTPLHPSTPPYIGMFDGPVRAWVGNCFSVFVSWARLHSPLHTPPNQQPKCRELESWQLLSTLTNLARNSSPPMHFVRTQ